MKERPILFSGEMVRAILDGRKTQTRRVIKPQPKPLTVCWMYDGKYFADDAQMQSYLFHDVAYADGTGDLLWVRETWQHCSFCGGTNYKACANDNGRSCQHCDNNLNTTWKPSIHMRYEDSRIMLRVVDVRAERVQEISEADAQAEGVAAWHNTTDGTVYRPEFRLLWDSINAARGFGWDTNPWVWVVEFEKVMP